METSAGRTKKPPTIGASELRSTEATSQDEKFQAIRLANDIDDAMGFPQFEAGKSREGWLINMHSTAIEDPKIRGGRAGVDFYFLDNDGEHFKATLEYAPYFLIATKPGVENEVDEWCKRSFEGLLKGIKIVEKEDLSLPNHLLGYRRRFLRLSFYNVSDLLAVRREIFPIVAKNQKNSNTMDTYTEMANVNAGFDLFDEDYLDKPQNSIKDASEYIIDIREYDVPYHVRVAIDKDIRIGKWYIVRSKNGQISLSCIEERLTRADPVVLAFDIETTKLPLKFPDPVIDQVMMISYMIDGQGYLVTNREIVSEDIADFEYTPKPEYEGPFTIFNEPDEKAVLERFFQHVKESKPTVIATYNGDFFDWSFVEARASVHGIDMYLEIGFYKDSTEIYQSDYCVHMDCFAWVNRDSYLPQGSRGLKAVTVAKLGYDPDELDPEVMTKYASERPQTLAEYSVSDAVATYYLYMKYIHPFIFSLCTIIPLNPDDVLRKGTGTLCEMLLSVQAYQKNIILPNKHVDPPESFWEGHLLHHETYVGGHVESIEAGVFRSDIPTQFDIDPTAMDELISQLDDALKFSIVVEEKKNLEDIANYEEIKCQIAERLMDLKTRPVRMERPSIYHLDVASMYPNIMTTNRLQPDSMIQESDCAACDFNRPGKTCDRRLPWAWRGEFFPAKRDEYNMIRRALANERFPGKWPNSPSRDFAELDTGEQAAITKKRLTEYSKKIYHKINDNKTVTREAIICQRENPFYVNTVRDFRDRRYDFKGKQKVWKNKTDSLKDSGAPADDVDESSKMIVLFDSLQLAHKVILNSFYGYVMRKGSRWYSMEMAGVTCLTGATIIQMARELVERIGRPLELDTDGIWCMLPSIFPENFSFTLKNGKKLPITYPCVMLNHLVHERFTNHQYQTLVDPVNYRYSTHSDNTIFFEVDGPYKAMILPTSKEEDKNLKKRYAVFNQDGSLAELKGFEVKRRGELKLIKIFQTQIFKFFLQGTTLAETYQAVAEVANRWLDVLYMHGSTLADEELIDLICENRSLTKALVEYGNQKSTSITTAKRLAEFLGDQMVKDRGLNCKYIIADRPKSAPVTDRAIPVAIFSAEYDVKRHFLRKWLRDNPGDMDPRNIIDWDYYLERLGSVVQKLVTIPAALQKIKNPVPRIAHPDWLQRVIITMKDKHQQKKMTDMFGKQPVAESSTNIQEHRLPSSVIKDVDIENISSSAEPKVLKVLHSEPAQKRKAPEKAAPNLIDPFSELPAKMPSITNDYEGWLRYQKKKWKIQKQARVRRRELFGERKNSSVTSGISSFFRNQAELIYVNAWQILQLKETETPGEVKMFALVDKKIHTLTVIVDRSILFNLKSSTPPNVSISNCQVTQVFDTLPNGHPSVHLFRMTMPEDTWLRESERISQMLNHPSVEGVYEKKVPLFVRVLLKLGSTCTFDESQTGILGKGLEQGFQLSSLLKGSATQNYLLDNPLEYIYLYHVISGDRQIFSIFSTTKEEAYIVILTKVRDAQGFVNADKVYAEALSTKIATSGDDNSWQAMFPYQEKLHFRRTEFTAKRKAHLEVGDIIRKLVQESNRPNVLVVQSPRRQLAADVPILKEHPVLSLRPDLADNELPSLGWQSVVTKRIVLRYLALGSWIQHLTELARYGDIPLCNLESDDPKFLIDVSYARRLEQGRIALWWSPSPLPDHGGYEKDDILGSLQDVELPSVNNAGTYQSVSIEIDVRNLAINTILTSSLINELEGSESALLNLADNADGAGVLYSKDAFSSAGILVLRDMVKAWWTEACHGNGMADVMVQHLIRWVEGSDSFMYDRALQYYVKMVSKKALQQLMTDFRRVGSQIIFASSNRLLLQTTKKDVGNAYAYSQYILKSIKGKPLFHFLDLEIKEFWDYLIWYDEFNFAGKGCQEIVEAEEQDLQTVLHWQLCNYLPQPLQSEFQDWVAEFIEIMYKAKRPAVRDDSRPTQLHFHSITDANDDEVTTFLKDTFSQPLKKRIVNLNRLQRHPGAALKFENNDRNPILELVKLLMQVLSLSKGITLETRLLRRDLLALFDVPEFSDTARFENPSGSLVLPQLICNTCTMARDLDLCRDGDILPGDAATESSKATATKPWLCLACGSEFNVLALEEKLIGEIQGLVVEWQTQDLKCSRCGALRISDFMDHCSCSGSWSGTLDIKTIRQRLTTFKNVGKFYNFEMLAGVADDLLSKM